MCCAIVIAEKREARVSSHLELLCNREGGDNLERQIFAKVACFVVVNHDNFNVMLEGLLFPHALPFTAVAAGRRRPPLFRVGFLRWSQGHLPYGLENRFPCGGSAPAADALAEVDGMALLRWQRRPKARLMVFEAVAVAASEAGAICSTSRSLPRRLRESGVILRSRSHEAAGFRRPPRFLPDSVR
jgi:hypothetical protein